jgi:hypothetical protein
MAYFTNSQGYLFLCSDIPFEEKQKTDACLQLLKESGISNPKISLFFYSGLKTSSRYLIDPAQDLIFRNSHIYQTNIQIIESFVNTQLEFART